MGIPQPLDNNKYQFVTRNKQAEPSNKVVELKDRQKQESVAYLVSCFLAAEALAYWLKPKKYPLSLQQVLKLLGISIEAEDNDGEELELIKFLEKQKSKKSRSFARSNQKLELIDSLKKSDSRKIGNLEDELRLRLDNLSEKYLVEIDDVEQVSEFFEFIDNRLKEWYFTDSRKVGFISGCVALEGNVLRVKNQLHARFEDIVSYGKKSSLNGSIIFWEKLSQQLQELEREYLEESKRYIDKENGNLRTYRKCLAVLKSDEADLDKLAENFRIAKKTLFNYYKFKIEAEAYSLAAQALKKVESTNQLYLGIFKDSDIFLSELKDDFLAKIKNSDVLMPLLIEISNQVNFFENLLEKVEQKVGHTLSSWGRYQGVTKKMVREALLKELEPIAQKICSNTQNQLNQEYQA